MQQKSAWEGEIWCGRAAESSSFSIFTRALLNSNEPALLHRANSVASHWSQITAWQLGSCLLFTHVSPITVPVSTKTPQNCTLLHFVKVSPSTSKDLKKSCDKNVVYSCLCTTPWCPIFKVSWCFVFVCLRLRCRPITTLPEKCTAILEMFQFRNAKGRNCYLIVHMR